MKNLIVLLVFAISNPAFCETYTINTDLLDTLEENPSVGNWGKNQFELLYLVHKGNKSAMKVASIFLAKNYQCCDNYLDDMNLKRLAKSLTDFDERYWVIVKELSDETKSQLIKAYDFRFKDQSGPDYFLFRKDVLETITQSP